MAPASRVMSDFDGLRSRTVFCLWTGDEAMSDNRLRALWTIFSNAGCPVAFINKNGVEDWEKSGFPFHPSFPCLSSTHKADYLRVYLMHHYGGGYADIKLTTKKWCGFFQQLEDSDRLALGYTELAHGIPHIAGPFGDQLRSSHTELIGLCAFIFKKNTALTAEWLAETEQLLDSKLRLLQQHPAQHPQDQTGATLPNGETSLYPLAWSELLGNIFHPLMYKYRANLIQAAIEPFFGSYR